MTRLSEQPFAIVARCAQCGTELAPALLSCPACQALVHAAELKSLAAAAEASAAEGKLVDAHAAWTRALDLLPESSQQHQAIRGRVQDLAQRIAATPGAKAPAGNADDGWHKRAIAIGITIGLFALTKAKFLLLGLTKASTFVSMFAFFALYWQLYGWALAAGLVLSIYIHEMGHVAELKRLGIAAGAPLFIPGIGALVMLKQRIDDPKVDARIGLAGPIWGLGAGLAAYVIYRATGNQLWAAIAQLTGLLNLFNLIPIWQLDGARGFHALSTWQRWIVVASVVFAYMLTKQGLLLLIAAVGIWRAMKPAPKEPDTVALGTFVILIGALSWLWTVPGIDPTGR